MSHTTWFEIPWTGLSISVSHTWPPPAGRSSRRVRPGPLVAARTTPVGAEVTMSDHGSTADTPWFCQSRLTLRTMGRQCHGDRHGGPHPCRFAGPGRADVDRRSQPTRARSPTRRPGRDVDGDGLLYQAGSGRSSVVTPSGGLPDITGRLRARGSRA